MSDIINGAVEALQAKLGDSGFDSSVKFTIGDEGSVVVDSQGARASDEETECTLTADADTFQSMMDGSLNPTAAFMTGKLSVDGDMSIAMKLGALLA
ncbi:MAG: putative sterol carrier protein [Paracoccaceae bacterium]|jgi:putative sterol carrier protein